MAVWPAHLLAKRLVHFDKMIPLPIRFCLLVDADYRGKKEKQVAN